MLNGKLLDILLIDDDETTNFINARTLRKAGVAQSIQIAVNGKEALDYLKKEGKFAHLTSYPQPDIIFLDINMPIMNGWEFLDAYNELPSEIKGNVIVVMLTTSLQVTDHEKVSTSPLIRGLVNKPLDKKTLIEVIKENLPDLVGE